MILQVEVEVSPNIKKNMVSVVLDSTFDFLRSFSKKKTMASHKGYIEISHVGRVK